ncbi:MAG: glycosyltransferase [Lachnospiraceae bacterium]|jgi:rhamnosyltransferase
MKSIDVVIPTYRPDGKLVEALSMLSGQNYPVRRIYILDTLLDDGSSGFGLIADKVELPDERLSVMTIDKDEFDHGGTRNMGAKLAKDADYILFMTQDAVPADDNLTAELIAGFAHERVAVTYARQMPRTDALKSEQLSRTINYPDKSRLKTQADVKELGIKTYFCSNVCAMYDTRIFAEIGGFIPHAIFNEDMIYAGNALKKGYAVYYCSGAKVIHSHNYTADQQFHRNFDIGVSQTDHPEIFASLSSEGEGVKYVKKMVSALKKEGAAREIPGFIAGCFARFTGYRLGRRYKKLSKSSIMKYTMNPGYWKSNDTKIH